MKAPKIAIFYDWLNQWGGAERVLLDLLKIFPDATVYTLVYDPSKTNWLPPKTKIITSFINKLPFSKKGNILYTPLYALALEQFNFSKYDIVISTTSVVGHCLITPPETLFISFLHNVNRYVYQTPKIYKFLTPLLNIYKKFDYIYSQRPDYIFCNSKTVQQRIKKNYNRRAEVIYPGIDTNFFKPAKNLSDKKYFMVVSRLVEHKKIDLVINTCHHLGLALKIVGEGRLKNKYETLIKNLNDPNIELLGKVNNQDLLNLYQNCSALICPQVEDFGLTPIEAQACGKPVIAFNKGGILETVIPNVTGLFFDQQNVESLTDALNKFSKIKFSSSECIKNSQRFSDQLFMLNFKQAVSNLWRNHQ